MQKILNEWRKYLAEQAPLSKRMPHYGISAEDPFSSAEVAAQSAAATPTVDPVRRQGIDVKKLVRGATASDQKYRDAIDRVSRVKGPPDTGRFKVTGWEGKGPTIKFPRARAEIHPGFVAALDALRITAHANENYGLEIYLPFSGLRTMKREKELWKNALINNTRKITAIFDGLDRENISNDAQLKAFCKRKMGSRQFASSLTGLKKYYGFCKSLNRARQVAAGETGGRRRQGRAAIFRKVTRRVKAPPGASAHLTGRAADVLLGFSPPADSSLIPAMQASPQSQWLYQYAEAFGMRITTDEPWHLEITKANADWALKTFGLPGKRTAAQDTNVMYWLERVPIQGKRRSPGDTPSLIGQVPE